ncbi:DUF1580 domain-containing protein [Limnoglobus roseus]|uniref:Uncharacterized protein n=1 Tax=Limnoglobus roseus TaxID=2598579 RepID=A0A5C1APG3_9BACT|nr:DUF1580 domain-containing protein [Limnoglobus roseus]QEL19906.1 hypothetical protein PX52LOC_06988 [Limnoglobus roseus]
MSVEQEIANGEGIGLAEAGRLLPGRSGKRVSPSSVLRWVVVGCKARDGRTVKLEAARVGSAWVTTKAAIACHVSALNTPVTPQPPPARSAAVEAGKVLQELGL